MRSDPQATDSSTLANPGAAARLSTAFATLLACAVLLPLLGHRSLAMWDEGIYAEIAREMLHHSWLVPTWNYQPWFEKPPLLFWLTATLFHVFGATEFWSRAVSAFSGVATVAVLHRFILRRFDLATAWISTVILLSTFGYLHVCRAGEMDSLLALTETLAVIGLAQVNERRQSGWLLFWLAFAAALMTKGGASVVLPLTLACVAIVERWRTEHLGRLMFGILLFLAAVAPWHLAMWHRFGTAFTAQYLSLHVLERASSQIEGHHTHAWYYLLVLLVSAPPWVLLYPSSLVAALRERSRSGVRIFAVFALLVLIFFTLVQTRLPHYIAPAYPALSLVAAVFLARSLRQLFARWQSSSSRAGILLAAACLWGGMVILTGHARKELHSPRMSNGMVTPDTHELAALLKRTSDSTRLGDGPLLLWTDPPIAPITTALFYSRMPVQQVSLFSDIPQPLIDEYTWSPVPLAGQISNNPRPLLAQRSALTQLPSGVIFSPTASSGHWEIGTIVAPAHQP